MLLEETLDKILKRYEFLKEQMLENANDSENFIRLSKEFSDLEDFANLINVYNKTKTELSIKASGPILRYQVWQRSYRMMRRECNFE